MLLASSPKVVADASGAVAVCINKINQQQQQAAAAAIAKALGKATKS